MRDGAVAVGLGVQFDWKLLHGGIERGIERPGQDPTEFTACLGGRPLGELLGNGAKRRAALELLDDAVGTALGLVGEAGLVDGPENLGDRRFGPADVWRDPA